MTNIYSVSQVSEYLMEEYPRLFRDAKDAGDFIRDHVSSELKDGDYLQSTVIYMLRALSESHVADLLKADLKHLRQSIARTNRSMYSPNKPELFIRGKKNPVAKVTAIAN